jgi:hypothetical protein
LRILAFWDAGVALLTVPGIFAVLGEFLQRCIVLEDEGGSVHEQHKDTAVFRNVGNFRPRYKEGLNRQYQRCGNLKYRIWFGFEIDRKTFILHDAQVRLSFLIVYKTLT